jgi:hypothetical protein
MKAAGQVTGKWSEASGQRLVKEKRRVGGLAERFEGERF